MFPSPLPHKYRFLSLSFFCHFCGENYTHKKMSLPHRIEHKQDCLQQPAGADDRVGTIRVQLLGVHQQHASQTEEPCVDEMQYDTILPCVFLEEEVDPIGEDGVTTAIMIQPSSKSIHPVLESNAPFLSSGLACPTCDKLFKKRGGLTMH
ncbi:hypothetical protein CAPTEDRAFT_212138 [Capitella teleta]|uniref:C2H2-type domain-containing protein n=1 Tax=Capitella teleta TaxID=283909 RepID=R7VLP6_CAPTE|nr:hypothetical protein CAPTEDRAFT_212138 [Capitella teleta]|eukprot:ELU17780.1 hypothetical protein CAPTEDRAFT_212138 [Capitella teleta]